MRLVKTNSIDASISSRQKPGWQRNPMSADYINHKHACAIDIAHSSIAVADAAGVAAATQHHK